MDQQENNLNQDIIFCETCRYRIKTDKGVMKCGFTEKSLRFYDRACKKYRPVQSDSEYIWDPTLNAYIIR